MATRYNDPVRIALVLPAPDWRRLARLAHEDERRVPDQAAWLLKRLVREAVPSDPADESVPAMAVGSSHDR